MKLTLVIVTSIDGRTTQDESTDQSVNWASKEDQEHFYSEVINKAKLMIMGSSTYDHAKHLMQHREGCKRVIMTHTPQKYEKEKIDGQLEFTDETPKELIDRFMEEGYTEAFHLGGSESASSFFREKLITNIIQTIEPKLFGKGKGIATDKLDISLHLEEVTKLNEKGTLLLKYAVLN
jgi:dihydrofolate reductase